MILTTKARMDGQWVTVISSFDHETYSSTFLLWRLCKCSSNFGNFPLSRKIIWSITSRRAMGAAAPPWATWSTFARSAAGRTPSRFSCATTRPSTSASSSVTSGRRKKKLWTSRRNRTDAPKVLSLFSHFNDPINLVIKTTELLLFPMDLHYSPIYCCYCLVSYSTT